MTASVDLGASRLWQATAARLSADLGTLLTVAAPFTLLIEVGIRLFGPPPPAQLADITPLVVFWHSLVPGIIGGIGALAVAWLVGRPGTTPRAALTGAVTHFPAYVLAVLGYGLVVSVGLLLFVVPGIYIAARLLPLTAVAALEGGSAGQMLRRSWALTEGHGAALLWFLTLAGLFTLCGAAMVGIVAAAIASVLTLIGGAAIGEFLGAVAAGGFGMLVTVGFAAAAVVIREQLA